MEKQLRGSQDTGHKAQLGASRPHDSEGPSLTLSQGKMGRDSLVVHWPRLHAPNAGALAEYPGGLLRLDPTFAYAEPPSS